MGRQRLAKDGLHVVAVARSQDKLDAVVGEINAEGGSAESLVCDIADSAAVTAAIEKVTDAHGRFDVLDVKTGDGGIEAIATEGSRLEANWRLNTGDGNLTLHLPATIAADVELRTNDGSIDFDMPVTISGRAGKKEVHGQINGGGKLLSLKTGDGSIRLEKR